MEARDTVSRRHSADSTRAGTGITWYPTVRKWRARTIVVHRCGTRDHCSATPVQGFGARVNRYSTRVLPYSTRVNRYSSRVSRCSTRRHRGDTAIGSRGTRMHSGEMAIHSRGAACDSRCTAMHPFGEASQCVRCRYQCFGRTFSSKEHDEGSDGTAIHCSSIAIDPM